jgi:hypothetical protein
VTRAATQAIVVACSTPHIHLWKLRNSTRFTWAFGKTASHNPGGPTRLWGCQARWPPAYSPETACPNPCHRRPSRAQFSFEVASKDRSCFHCASTARRAWKQLPAALDKNSCADNELAGAPEEIRTPDPQIRSLAVYSEEKTRWPSGFGSVMHQTA